MKQGSCNLLIILLVLKLVLADERFMVVVHRHGDRTPVFIPENYKVDWPQGEGQLTGTGVNQLFLLGEKLKDFYPELPTNYTSGVLYSRASDTDRTLQSAQSMMVGLFPPFTGPVYEIYPETADTIPNYSLPYGFQPVPIHSILASTDYELRAVDNCVAFRNYLNNDLYTSEKFVTKQNENSELLGRLSAAFNTTVTLANLNGYYDLLACEYFHGLPDRNGISEEDIQATMELYNWVSIQQFLPSLQSPLIGGALLDLIISDFANRIKGSSPSIARFYSAHDVTLQAVLSAMQETTLVERGIPPYASYLIFLLTTTSSNQSFVQMYFNSVNETSPITLCNGKEEANGCPYEYFTKQVSKYTLTAQEAEMKCSSGTSAGDNNILGYFGFAIVGAILLGVVLLIIIFAALYIRHRRKIIVIGSDSKEVEMQPVDEENAPNNPHIDGTKETEIKFSV